MYSQIKIKKNGSYFFSDYYYLNKNQENKTFVDDATNIHDKNDLIKVM